MQRAVVLQVFQSLAAKPRLDLFCRLAHAGPRGMVAGELAREAGLPATNLSFHLRAMRRSGLVSVEPEGRYQRYRANVSLVMTVLAFLAQNCAQGLGKAECFPAPAPRRRAATRARRAA